MKKPSFALILLACSGPVPMLHADFLESITSYGPFGAVNYGGNVYAASISHLLNASVPTLTPPNPFLAPPLNIGFLFDHCAVPGDCGSLEGTESSHAATSGSVSDGHIDVMAETNDVPTGDCAVSACGGSRAVIILGWYDTIRLHAPPGAPAGAKLSYFPVIHMDYQTLSADGFADAQVIAALSEYAIVPGTGSSFIGLMNKRASSVLGATTVQASDPFVVTGVDGQAFVLIETVQATCDSGGIFSSSCKIDVSGSATFTLDPITPGATYDTASGLSYLSGAVTAAEPTYTITTVAGNGNPDFPAGDGVATAVALVPEGVAVDSFGSLFVIDRGSATGGRPSTVRKVTAGQSAIATLGCDGQDTLGIPPFPDTLPAHQALCGNLAGVAVDRPGNVYITQGGGRTVDFLDPAYAEVSIISIPPLDVNGPQNAAVDSAGNVYVADTGNCRVIRTSPAGGFSVVAGIGFEGAGCGFSGDNGPALSAELQFPQGVAVDTAGNVYIADSNNARVRKVDSSGTITTVAGNGCTTYGAGDGGPAIDASLCYPSDVAVDSMGNLFIAETNSGLVRRVDTSGNISTIAGSTTATTLGDGGPATNATLSFPFSIAVGPSGKLYVADSGHSRVRLLTPSQPTAVAGVTTHSTGFVYSRVTHTFNGSITVTNSSLQAVAGPLQLVLTNLPPGVTLSNATGTTGGNPFVTVPSGANLEPGQSASVNVQFADPSNARITFTPILYSGTF